MTEKKEENKKEQEYIEVNPLPESEHQRILRRNQIVFMILLALAISSLFYAGFSVHKYSEMLKNPIGYNLAHFGIPSCTYWDTMQDTFITINATQGAPQE